MKLFPLIFYIVTILMVFPLKSGAETAYFAEDNSSIIVYDNYMDVLQSVDRSGSLQEELLSEIRMEVYDVRISPDKQNLLLLVGNTPPTRTTSRFYVEDRDILSRNWWIYNTQTGENTVLPESFGLVDWWTNAEIIYSFGEQEVAVTKIDELSSFDVLYRNENGFGEPYHLRSVNEQAVLITSQGAIFSENGSYRMRNLPNISKHSIVSNSEGRVSFSMNNVLGYFHITSTTTEYQEFQVSKSALQVAFDDIHSVGLLDQQTLYIVHRADQTTRTVSFSRDIHRIFPAFRDQILIEVGGEIILYNLRTEQEQATELQSITQQMLEEQPPEDSSSAVSVFPLVLGLIFIFGAGGYLMYIKIRR